MVLDWLLGERVVRDSSWGNSAQFGSSYTVSITDVQEIVSRLERRGATEVQIVRLVQGTAISPYRDASSELVDLHSRTVDAVLDAIAIVARWPDPTAPSAPVSWRPPITARVDLGSAVPARVMVNSTVETVHEAKSIADEVVEVVVCGVRRVPSWKWVQLGRAAGAAVLLSVWVVAAYQLRGVPAAAAVLGLGAFAFARQTSRGIDRGLTRRIAGTKSGVVSIDATPIDQLRIQRRNRRTSTRVAAASSAVTLAAAALTAWLAGLLTTPK